jgi:hypothetical protein
VREGQTDGRNSTIIYIHKCIDIEKEERGREREKDRPGQKMTHKETMRLVDTRM